MRVTSDDSAAGDSAALTPEAKAAARPPAIQAVKLDEPPSRAEAPAGTRPATRLASSARNSSATPTVSLAGAGDSKRHAEQAVNESGAKLARVDANSFDAEDAQTYLQAVELERAARRALDGRDYLAAVDLSHKASDLAGSLSANRNRVP